MKPFVEQRMFTLTEQIAVVQQNEMNDGLVLITQEVSPSDHSETRLYLTTAEAEELVFMLKSMVHRIKNY
jgi:hypothetical protein